MYRYRLKQTVPIRARKKGRLSWKKWKKKNFSKTWKNKM